MMQALQMQQQATIDSREVAGMVGRRHDQVLRDITTTIKHLSTDHKIVVSDYFIESSYEDKTGRGLTCFLLTKKGCELYATRMTGAKGTQFAVQYIERFNQMETALKTQILPSYQIADPIERAKKWIEEQQQVQQLEQKVIEQQPKVLFADSVAASKTSILVGEMAKLLKQNGVDIGPNRFFEWLRENGYLIKRKGTDYNTPTQRAMDLELFEIKETVINHNDGPTSIQKTSKVTGKGQLYFINKFLVGDTNG